MVPNILVSFINSLDLCQDTDYAQLKNCVHCQYRTKTLGIANAPPNLPGLETLEFGYSCDCRSSTDL